MVDFQKRDTHRGIAESDDEGDGSGEESNSEDGHDHHGGEATELGVAVLTVSSTRSLTEDPSGDAIASICEEAGHVVVTRELVSDDYDRVKQGVDAVTTRGDVDVVVTTGGTGVTPDDVTIEATEPLFEKELPGFGELFRRRSEEEIGTRVVATRATAGIAGGVPVFCLPGSEDAVRLGTGEIIVPEVGHLVHLVGREETNKEA